GSLRTVELCLPTQGARHGASCKDGRGRPVVGWDPAGVWGVRTAWPGVGSRIGKSPAASCLVCPVLLTGKGWTVVSNKLILTRISRYVQRSYVEGRGEMGGRAGCKMNPQRSPALPT